MVRALTLLLLFLLAASPARALDQSQIKSACYEDCAKETGSNPEFKACVARAADTADGLLNEEFAALQVSVRNAAKDMGVKPDTQLDMLTTAQRQWIAFRGQGARNDPGRIGRAGRCDRGRQHCGR